MLATCRHVCFVLAAALLAVGCDNRTTTSRPSKPDTPTIKELADEARLLKELIGTDACVCAFSGTCLEVWLECEVQEGGERQSETYPSLPVAVTPDSCEWVEKPSDIAGKIIVWGDVMQSPTLRILLNYPSGEEAMSETNSTLDVPRLPIDLGEGWRGGSSSGLGFHWECPAKPPGEGEAFTIASWSKTFSKSRREDSKKILVPIRESTLRLRAKRLPMVAPDLAPGQE